MELTGHLKPPFSLLDPESGAVICTTEDPEELIARWREDQSRRMVNADGEELGLISAASRISSVATRRRDG